MSDLPGLPPAPGPRRVLLEVCIATADDATAAGAGGADRLELNGALELGGLTPSAGTLAEVRAACGLPVVGMVRPRPGGFCYSAAEFRTMRRDADALLAGGAVGVVFGILDAGGRVDAGRCGEIVRQVGPAAEGAVFHRAFDYTPEPFEALEQLIDLGVRRVLTSGQRPTAGEGAELIAELVRRARGRIEILPGSGVRAGNAAALVDWTGCDQIHGSFREKCPDSSLAARPELSLSGPSGPAGGGFAGTSRRAVAEVVAALKGSSGR